MAALPAPHGGHLVERVASGPDRERRLQEALDLPRLHPLLDELQDAEKIAIGAYSPLTGFMGASAVDSVLTDCSLPEGPIWSMPVILAPGKSEDVSVVRSARPGDSILLADAGGQPHSWLDVEETFPLDHADLARRAFGTEDPAHPNVADLRRLGERAIAGTITLLHRLPDETGGLELDPTAVREEFRRRGWSRVAAYQCRNPPHTAHEHLQRVTLEREDIDGLFVHPVVGRLKPGDYEPAVILRAYRALLENYYPQGRVFLSSLTIAMRYAGPKAALFLAIVRKNYGCSDYIVGRDQAGVGKFYDPYACHTIFDRFDVGIRPLRYEETFYCRRCNGMASARTCAHPLSDRMSTSQTEIRALLRKGAPLPPEILRPEVAQILSEGAVVRE